MVVVLRLSIVLVRLLALLGWKGGSSLRRLCYG
jgi:hypothetical protein